MAYTTINDPEKYFKTVLWTGNLFANSITGVNHQPDLLWFKNRGTTNNFEVIDSSRGTNKKLRLDDEAVEGTSTTRITSFDSDGFTLSTDPSVNGNQNSILAWSWKANGGTTATISGGVNAVVQKEDTAKFAIGTYTGTGSQTGAEHGLGVKPDFIIIKNRDQDDSWFVWHNEIGNNQALVFDTNSAVITNNSYMGNEAPQSTWVGLGTGSNTNADGEKYVAYCWNEVKGFSKFGKYQGNNNADGPFVFLGFRPEFLLIKKTDATANWISKTGKVSEHNVHPKITYWDISNAENTAQDMDLLSNGFKHRSSEGDGNGSNTYAYFAWARTPMVTSKGTPGTAV